MRRQELLREQQRKRARAPRYLHNWEEPNLDSLMDLMGCPCARNNRHTREVHGVLDRRDNQVAHDNLPDLGLGGGAPGKNFLEQGYENVSEWRGN